MKTVTRFMGILMIWMTLSSPAGFARQSPQQAPAGHTAGVEKIIKAYYAAYEKKDWHLMEGLLAEGFTFSSPKDDHINIKSYRERCWPNAYKIKRFDVEKLIVNGDDAFVTYNGWTTDGKLFRNTEYFKLKGGKIKENECFFGRGINYPDNTGK